MNRRQFLTSAGKACAASAVGLPACRRATRPEPASRRAARLLFTSRGRTCLIHADGSGCRTLDFRVPNQVTWQPGPFLPDGRVIFLSMEARRDGPGRPFAEYYHKTPTRLWLYDLDRDDLVEIAARDRLAPFYTPALYLGDGRLLVQVVRDQGGQIHSMRLDGTDAREFTRLGEGLPYGLSLSPDQRRVAYHLASPHGYQIWTSNTEGGDRVRVAAHPDRLYFGPTWSPCGQWLVFQSCDFRNDPAHDWSDVVRAHPDGSGLEALTQGQTMWFGATYGSPSNRGGGSSIPVWSRTGEILFPRRLPGSKVPWEYQSDRPDTDHFNRDFRPELSRGGTAISRLSADGTRAVDLTPATSGVWDFRGCESPDGRRIAFCRAETGGAPALWVMGSDGGQPRELTRGLDDGGADHPRWVP